MPPDTAQAGPLRFEIDVPPEVRHGAPVQIRLRATNVGTEPLDLHLRGREIAFDITVTAEDGVIVWRRLEGRTVPAILQVKTLRPGESLELGDVWDQQTKAGMAAGPGFYTVAGTFPTDPRRPAKTPIAPLQIVTRKAEPI
jgi:intracellular proteinase inhibitor BsuPI